MTTSLPFCVSFHVFSSFLLSVRLPAKEQLVSDAGGLAGSQGGFSGTLSAWSRASPVLSFMFGSRRRARRLRLRAGLRGLILFTVVVSIEPVRLPNKLRMVLFRSLHNSLAALAGPARSDPIYYYCLGGYFVVYLFIHALGSNKVDYSLYGKRFYKRCRQRTGGWTVSQARAPPPPHQPSPAAEPRCIGAASDIKFNGCQILCIFKLHLCSW